MKNFCLLIFALIIVSCDSNKERAIPDGFALQPVNFLNKRVHLPEAYLKVNLNEIAEMLRQNPDLDPIDQFQLRQAVALQKNSPVAPVLYQDSINKSNVIWFAKMPYTFVDRNLAATYIDLLENSLIPENRESGIQFEKLEGKYTEINGYKCIKVKFKVSNQNKTIFTTQYIATRDLETTMIASSKSENSDDSYLLRTLK